MKKNSFHIAKLAALVLATTLVLSSCDFAAKNLAKQTVDTAKQMTELQDKAAGIEEKAAALSPKDRRAFQAELERLGVAGSPEWLYGDEAALLTGAPEETEDERGGGILGFIGGLFGGGGSSSSGGRGRVDSAFNGTWIDDESEDTMTVNNGNWESTIDGSPAMKGTLTTSGGTYSLTITEVNFGHKDLSIYLAYGFLEPKWYTRTQFRTASSSFVTVTDSDLDQIYFTYTGPYSISGNKLTMTMDGEPSTFTKRR